MRTIFSTVSFSAIVFFALLYALQAHAQAQVQDSKISFHPATAQALVGESSPKVNTGVNTAASSGVKSEASPESGSASGSESGTAQAGGSDAVLNALVREALDKNPQLDALQAQIQALKSKQRWVASWKDPKMALSYLNLPLDALLVNPEPTSVLNLRVEQTIPWLGKTEARAGVIRQQAELSRWQLAEQRVQLRALVKRSYYQLALLRQLKGMTQKHINLVKQLIVTVRSKYEQGKASQHELLRLGLLRDRLSDDLQDFDRDAQRLQALINASLHRAEKQAIATPDDFPLIAAPDHTLPELEKTALEQRPLLKALAQRESSLRAAAELSELEIVPDLTVFAAYGLRPRLAAGQPGQHLLSFGLAAPLPVFADNSYGAKRDESLARARSSASERLARIDQIRSGLDASLADWQRARSKAQTYNAQLIPAAQQTLDATLASYQVERASFLDLFNAELELLNFEKSLRTARVKALLAKTQIETLTGLEQ